MVYVCVFLGWPIELNESAKKIISDWNRTFVKSQPQQQPPQPLGPVTNKQNRDLDFRPNAPKTKNVSAPSAPSVPGVKKIPKINGHSSVKKSASGKSESDRKRERERERERERDLPKRSTKRKKVSLHHH